MSEKGPVISQGPHHIQNYASTNEVWVLVLRFFMFPSVVSPGFTLVFDPRDRLGGQRGKVGSASE